VTSYKGQRTKVVIRVMSKRSGLSNTTSFIQVKNLSKKDQIDTLDLSYVDSSSKRKAIHLADSLQAQKTIKLDFAQAGITAQLVQLDFSWKFGGIKYGASQSAKLGSYYYSLKASFKADGSEETYFGIQKPLRKLSKN
jgi:hypothetical protein